MDAKRKTNVRMTTKRLAQIEQLAKEGWCDAEIGRRLGIDTSTARRWRIKFGLPVGKKGRTYPARRYTVYERKTSRYLFEGTGKEIADFLGLSRKTIYAYIHLTLKGKVKKYEFYEVTG